MKLWLFSVLVLSLCLINLVKSIPFLKEDPQPQCGYQSCNPTKEGYINVHLVPHTHDDVGWVKTVDEYFYGSNLFRSSAGVQYILDTVVDSLRKNPSRRFIYVETAFFWKWWTQQSDDMQNIVKQLVENGQLEFISGGWSMNDEAVTHYQSIIDQMTWGLRRLNDTFGACGVPKVAWQIDPFGHSREMANIFKQLGFDAFILNRIDYQDKSLRATEKELEFMWKSSDILPDSNIFTSILLKHYNPPNGLCFDITCTDDPIIDDVESPGYNVNEKIDYFFTHVYELVNSYRTNNVLVTMGDDFAYQSADKWYKNMDKLISLVNGLQINGSFFNVIYSTPSCYIKAVHDETDGKFNTTLKSDDFFPYASDSNSYWTGFYTSRPALKRFERIGNNFLQICKQLASLTGSNLEDIDKLTLLREAMGVMQHHDAITGTEKLVVAMDYARILQKGIASCEDLTYSALNKLLVNDSSESTPELYKDMPDLQLTTCPLTNLSQCEVSEDSQSFVVTLYNPLGKSVNKFVRLPVTGTAYVVTDSQGNNLTTDIIPIPKSVQILPGRNTTATVDLTFLATDIPALGFKSYFIQKTAGNNVIVQNNSTTEANSTFVGVVLDQNTGFLSHIQVNGTYYDVNQSLWYYVGSLAGLNDQPSGAYVFKPLLDKTRNNYQNVTNKADFYEIYRGKLFVGIVLNNNTGFLSHIQVNGTYYNVNHSLWYYKGNYGVNVIPNNRASGAYVFRPSINLPENSSNFINVTNKTEFYEIYRGELFVGVVLDNNTGFLSHIQVNGTYYDVNQTLWYYKGYMGVNAGPTNRASGNYIFRPSINSPEYPSYFVNVTNKTEFYEIYRGELVTEIHQRFSNWTSQIIRLYKGENFVEFDWLVGYPDYYTGLPEVSGKEYVSKFETNLKSAKTFYTDSNGRQGLQRVRNYRPSWNATIAERESGNFYPIVSKILIRDEETNVEFAVLTDRAQGGSSLKDGELELMIYRNCLSDDGFGVNEPLVEIQYGTDIAVRGSHYVIIGEGGLPLSQIEKEVELRKLFDSWVYLSPANGYTYESYKSSHRMEFSGLQRSLPYGVHLLTLEPWNDSTLLLRLEHLNQVTVPVWVDIQDLFATFKLKSIKETTLGANQWIEETRNLKFTQDDSDNSALFEDILKSREVSDDPNNKYNITLTNTQIRTFVVEIEY